MSDQHDLLGNRVPPMSPTALAGVNAFVGGFLAYETQAVDILAAAQAEPQSALANAYAGVLYMLFEAPEGVDLARPCLARAEAAASGDPREQGLIAFLRAWIEDDIPEALRISAEVVAAFPTDLAMVKLHQYLAFNGGDFPAMLRIAELALPANGHVPYIHGMLAFAYEQCHLLADAEAAARQALSMTEREPWAQHALAHVMLTQGRIDEGEAFMTKASRTWTGLNSFMDTHNWWHLALFRLSQGRFAEVLAIYDEHCWGRDHDYSQDQIGAVSLLARMEFASIDVGSRWEDVARHLETRSQDTVQPFLSLQYLYGLARAGRPEAGSLMKAIEARTAAAPPHVHDAWLEAALPAAEAIMAFTGGDHERAVRRMGAALPRMVEVGGSHAQRDLFEQIHLQALLGAGRFTQAQQVLELRRGFDPEGVPINLTLARVYDALGLPRQSAQAADRARRTLERHA